MAKLTSSFGDLFSYRLLLLPFDLYLDFVAYSFYG
jgi:hypothetical protein